VSPITRVAVLAETLALFGPITLVLFMAPIGVLAALGGGHASAALLVALALAGGIGLYMVLNLAAHAVDATHSLPATPYVLLGVALGLGAALVVLWLEPKTPWLLAVVVGPLVGSAHLLWLNRRALWPAA